MNRKRIPTELDRYAYPASVQRKRRPDPKRQRVTLADMRRGARALVQYLTDAPIERRGRA